MEELNRGIVVNEDSMQIVNDGIKIFVKWI